MGVSCVDRYCLSLITVSLLGQIFQGKGLPKVISQARSTHCIIGLVPPESMYSKFLLGLSSVFVLLTQQEQIRLHL